ncbi:HNH endonuclease [Enterococcus thailandicus]|nr:HNH endonuclease [Enterococcus thailandicus]
MAKYCRQEGCRTLVIEGQYCDEHKRKKVYEKRFYSKNKSFYKTQAWKSLADYVRFRDNYKCTICGKPVFGRDSQVDHKLPIWLRPELRLDEDNCRLVCSSCHPKVEYKPKDSKEKNLRRNFDPAKYF